MRRAAWSRPAIRGASLRRAIAVALAALMLAALFSAPTASAQTNVIQVTFDTPPYTYPASYSFRDFSVHQTNTYSAGYVGQAITSSGNRHTYGGPETGLAAAFTMRFWSPVPVHTISAWVYLAPSSSANGCLRWGNLQLVCVSPSPNWQYVQATYPANVTTIQLSFSVYSMTTTTVGLDQVTIWPTAPSTPTPTPTPSPTPTLLPPSGVSIGSCPLLGRDADFSGFPGRWQILSERLIGYNRFQGLLMLPGHKLGIQLPLRPDVKYQISGSFYPERIVDTPRSLYVSLGASTFIVQPQLYRDESVSFEFPPATFQPGPDGTYMLILERPSTDNGLFEIKRICVSEYRERDVPISETETEDEPPAACQACDPPDSILDIFGIIGWLLCGIRNFFECVIVPFLAALARGVLDLLATALSFIEWIVRVVLMGCYGWRRSS